MEKVFIIINGPSCAGKSSVVTEIGKIHPELFHLCYDRLKWSYFDYNYATHSERVYELLALLETYAIGNGLSMIKDGGLYRDKIGHLMQIAKDAGYRIVEVNITAPPDVLIERFRKRVEEVTALNKKISNTSEGRFWEIHEQTEAHTDKTLPTYDTSKMTSEEIAKEIISLI